jgi:enoyl-CoA hydratase
MTDALHYSLEGNVALLHMDDGKANALSDTMLRALLAAIDRAEKEASVMILSGRPGRFCAGFDLKVMMAGPEAALGILSVGADLLMRLYGVKIPLVIACTGHALAGGALMLLTGDTRIGATGDFRIGLNEVQIGMPVPLLAMELARDRITTTELTNATLEAKVYGPDEAAKVGYLDAVVPADDLLARAKAEATRLAGLAQPAFRLTKERLRGRTIDYITKNMEADTRALLKPIG